MNRSLVALVRCPDYEEEHVSEAVTKGLRLLGGVGSFVKQGEKALLKPNMLIGSAPEKCVATHPSVFAAVGRIFKEAGAIVSYGDSPSFGGLDLAARLSGIKAAADRLGFEQADFSHGTEVSHKDALLAKKITIADAVLAADAVISISKLKTHGLTRMTGAIKNQFGCVPGILKGQFHAKMADPHNFATMLVDINTLVKPRLFVMDAVMAMEGNGPRNGKPRPVGLLLFSRDPVALDAVACKLINLNPEFVPTSAPGEKAGLGTYHFENVEIVGEAVEPYVVKDFDVVREPVAHESAGRMRVLVRNWITPRPSINRRQCNSCGTCVKMCPVGKTALDWMVSEGKKVPKHNYTNCIRCYCCQETCPQGAITINTPLLSRLMFRH